jgi:hypothetical protein
MAPALFAAHPVNTNTSTTWLVTLIRWSLLEALTRAPRSSVLNHALLKINQGHPPPLRGLTS